MAASSRRAASTVPWRRERPLRLALWLALFALMCVAASLGSRRLWLAVCNRPEFRVDPTAVALKGLPRWVKEGPMEAELRRQLEGVPPGRNLFDPGLAHAVQHELRACPWVLDVPKVQRALPNSLLAGAVFRKPAALVSFGGRRYMIDIEGYWLPDDLFQEPPEWRQQAVPVIRDRLLQEPPPMGQPWDPPRLEVGARLIQFLWEQGLFSRLHVESVDVTGVGRDTVEPDIELITPNGARVKWGKSSTYAHVEGLQRPAFLVPDEEKLQMLLSKLDRYPDLRGLRYMDLRFHGQIAYVEEGD